MDSSKKTRQIDVGNARTIVICIPTIFVRVRDGFRYFLIPLMLIMLRLDANNRQILSLPIVPYIPQMKLALLRVIQTNVMIQKEEFK